MTFTYGSVCSGIEAATSAWHPLGWTPAFFSEIDKFPQAVLKHHYPDVPLHGDFTTIGANDYGTIDLLVGGTPCQSFSIAGLRGGMDDDRGNLALEYLKLAKRKRPTWLVWENVPGVLSSNGGKDFGSFLGGLGQLGYGFAYRVLDAQYFGVAQRRRRVFVIGYLGDWRPAAAVLFEQHSLQGHPAPSRKKGEDFAVDVIPSLTASGRGVARAGETKGQDPVVAVTVSTLTSQPHADRGEADTDKLITVMSSGQVNAEITDNMAPTLNVNRDGAPILFTHIDGGGQVAVAFTLHGSDQTISTATETETCGTIRTKAPGSIENSSTTIAMSPVAFAQNTRDEVREMDVGEAPTKQKRGGEKRVGETPFKVRRLVPEECEFLQGFPRGFTRIPWRGKDAEHCPDGPRYKALGNSMAVPCMVWLGKRIQTVTELIK